jgi:hypothetical protein
VYYSRINPLVRFELTDTGLAFENPAVKARLSEAPKQGYHATWYRFNNSTGAADQIGSPTTASQERLQAPADLPREREQLREGLGARRRTAARALGHARGRLLPPRRQCVATRRRGTSRQVTDRRGFRENGTDIA